MEAYAILNVAGKQIKATENARIRVPRLDAEVGAQLDFDQVLLVSAGGSVQVGRPFVEGKSVQAEVLRHGRDKKVVVFKKKRRKDYRRKNGHRQGFTEIIIKGLPS